MFKGTQKPFCDKWYLKATFVRNTLNLKWTCKHIQRHCSVSCWAEIKQDKSSTVWVCQPAALRTFLFPPYSSHGMLSLSTCRLIPLLAAGQQVNWYPPPRRRWGVHLDETLLGGSCFGRLDTRGNDILSSLKSPHLAASIFPQLPTHADRAQSIQLSPAGVWTQRLVSVETQQQVHTNGKKAFVNAYAHTNTRTTESCAHIWL